MIGVLLRATPAAFQSGVPDVAFSTPLSLRAILDGLVTADERGDVSAFRGADLVSGLVDGEGHVGAQFVESIGGRLAPVGRDDPIARIRGDEDRLGPESLAAAVHARFGQHAVEGGRSRVPSGVFAQQRETQDGPLTEPEQADPVGVEVEPFDRVVDRQTRSRLRRSSVVVPSYQEYPVRSRAGARRLTTCIDVGKFSTTVLFVGAASVEDDGGGGRIPARRSRSAVDVFERRILHRR